MGSLLTSPFFGLPKAVSDIGPAINF